MKTIYEQKSINRLVLTFSIPAIFALLLELSTSVVDTLFAGNIGVGSADALSAMGILSPLLAIFTALQTLFSVSTAIMIAKHLNNKLRRDQYFLTGLTLSFAIATAASILCYILLTPMLSALGADGSVFVMAAQYLKIQLISTIFSSIGYTATACIRAFGYPKSEAFIISLAVLINIAFNALFTFGFALGIVGIALGTLVSEITCATIACIFLKKKGLFFPKTGIKVKQFARISFDLFKIGIAQTAIQVFAGSTGFFINARLFTFGTITHIAAWNVVQKIYMFMLMPIVGLAQGMQTILAYFSGNSSDDKMKKVARLSILYCGLYGLLATSVTLFSGDALLGFFGLTTTLHVLARPMLTLVFLTFPLTGVLYTNMTLLQVTERELASVLLILTRQVFAMIPLVMVLPPMFLQANAAVTPAIAIFFAVPIADIVSTILAVFLIRKRPEKRQKNRL